MSSWQLLRHLTAFWSAIDNPIFWRETFRPPIWQAIVTRIARATGLSLMLGGLVCYLNTLLVFYLNNLLILLVPLLLLWMWLLGMTLGPVVVQERQNHTWETLLTTPLSTETILLGKAGGAMWWLRHLMRLMSGVLMLMALGVGVSSLVLVPSSWGTNSYSQLPTGLFCGLTTILPLVSAILFVLDRMQQFVLTALAALAASVSSTTVRGSMTWASVAAMVVWLLDILAAALLMAVQPDFGVRNAGSNMLMISTLGPMIGYLTKLPIVPMVLCMLGTMLIRELAVRRLWIWTVQRARQPLIDEES